MVDSPQFQPDQLAYFDELDVEKQTRYERRVAREILSGLGFTNTHSTYLEQLAAEKTGVSGGFTPEWVSDHLGCPVTFMAIKDYHLSKDDGFPDPVWLLSHGTFGKFTTVFAKTWEEARSRFGSSHVAVCIRPAWASSTLVLHNYDAVTRYTTGVRNAPARILWPREEGMIIMHYLRDMLCVLRARWKPSVATE